MPYPRVTHPIPCPAAFARDDAAAVQSQGVLLLLLGVLLRSDVPARRSTPSFRTLVPESDLREFPIPTLRRSSRRLRAEDLQRRLILRAGGTIVWQLQGVENETIWAVERDVRVVLAHELYQDPTPARAALLMEACLGHPDRFVRVCAATALLAFSLEPRRLLWTLVQGTHSPEPLVRTVAATALARVAPEHPRLQELLRGPDIGTELGARPHQYDRPWTVCPPRSVVAARRCVPPLSAHPGAPRSLQWPRSLRVVGRLE